MWWLFCPPVFLFSHFPSLECPGQYTHRSFWRWIMTINTFQSGLHSLFFVGSSLNLWRWWHVVWLTSWGNPVEGMDDCIRLHCQNGVWDCIGSSMSSWMVVATCLPVKLYPKFNGHYEILQFAIFLNELSYQSKATLVTDNPLQRLPAPHPLCVCVCVCFCCLRLTQKGWWQVCFGCYPFRKNVSPYLDFFIILITRYFFWKENQGTPVHAPYNQIIHWLNCAFDFYLTIMYKNYIPLQGIHKHKVFTCEIIKTMYRWTCTHTCICAHIVIHNHTMTYTHNCICFPL